ncbi:MAG: hypothetical protein EOO50_05275 [Flavobacterium sp.]|uniref:DUF6712 family protein n=1 Tax=Flavobacterium sp. TaxID=239 RepID=UPI0012195A18|nr:hypothetical protein [Flavobacterium sp.]RZJ67695.1 MAG: hypothetical protein EOO50_05275 [Flavobacterium sp.]
MTPIITIDDLRLKKDVAKTTDTDKINPIILQAQDVDLRDYLGMHFYFDVLSNLETPSYQDLLSGSTFMQNGVQFAQDGLKSMLIDLTYSRLMLEINVNITPFGATTKLTVDSEPTSQAALKDKAQQNRESAASKWEIIKLYLDDNKQLFPHYNYKADTIRTGERKLKFWRI